MDFPETTDEEFTQKFLSMVVHGRNSGPYKFAFAKSLLDAVDPEQTVVTIDQLALPSSPNMLLLTKNR